MASKLDEQDGRSSDIDMSELPGCLPSFLFSWPPQDDGDYQASFLRSELVARVRILFPSQSNTDCYNRMIGLAGPKSGPGDSEYEQPVRGAYHGTEIEGHGVFDRHHHVRVSDREWDNENLAPEISTDRFQLIAQVHFVLSVAPKIYNVDVAAHDAVYHFRIFFFRGLEDVEQQAIIDFCDE